MAVAFTLLTELISPAIATALLVSAVAFGTEDDAEITPAMVRVAETVAVVEVAEALVPCIKAER